LVCAGGKTGHADQNQPVPFSAQGDPFLRIFYFAAEQNQNDFAEVKAEIRNKLQPGNFDLTAGGLIVNKSC
jgi:hypothetical protein